MTRSRAVALGLLLVCFAVLVAGMPRNSLTFDEPSHLASGYAAVARGHDGLWTMTHRGHPLLIDAWSALPLYVGSPNLALETLPGWQTDYKQYVGAFIREIGPLGVVEIAGRVPVALLTVLLGAITFRWGQDLTQNRRGWLALALLVLDPNILAHGRLATNDLGVTALGTLALYLAWRGARGRSRWWWLPGGLVLGLTCLAKSSGVLWPAAVGLYLLTRAILDTRRRSSHLCRTLGVGLVTLATIWVAYGLRVGAIAPEIPLPLPAPQHWRSLFFQTDSAGQRLAYALGLLRTGGWWWYFPLAWVLKTPIPLLLASLSGGVLVARTTRDRSDLLLPAVFAVVYVGVAVGIGPNLGYRHLLPVLPLAVLAAAVAGDALRTAGTSSGLLAWPSALKASLPVLLIGWTACATLTATPNELAYFNEIAAILVGSPRDLAVRKHELLISSNLDWGQGMKLLASYLATETDATIYVAYRHPAPYPMPADAYLVPHPDAEPMSSPFHPEPGRYLIGATSLHVPASCCGLGLDSYAYFRNLGPDDTVGDAILVYDIAPEDQPAWLIQCGAPVSPLADETVEAGLARAERLRRVQMDCSRTWLYPQGQGIYAFAAADPALSDPYVTRHLASTRLSYVQPAGFVPAPFRLYEIMGHPAANLLPASRVGRAAVPPAAQPNAARSHVVLDGNLEFLGLSVLVPVEDGANHASTLDISTWWRVVGPLPSEPLSVMAHVVTEDGQTLGVADGLGLLPSQLTVQDILVQRHSFAIPQSTSPSDLWLRTGIYALSDQVRWPVDGCPGCDAVFVSLDS